MTRILSVLALLATVTGWGLWQRSRAVSAEERAGATEALVAGYAEAARMRAVRWPSRAENPRIPLPVVQSVGAVVSVNER